MDYTLNTDHQFRAMLERIGAGKFEDLIQGVPEQLRQPRLDVPPGLSELEVLRLCQDLASKNRSLLETAAFLGAGSYSHVVPTVVDALSSRGEWLTPYTPYQAEASQGTLQVIYEFQSMVCELMQMDVANASMYDGASAAAEAAVLALRTTGRTRVLVAEAVHPHIRQVIATYLSGADVVIQEVPSVNGVTDIEALSRSVGDDVACVVMQQPNVFGVLEPMAESSGLAHRAGALFIASVYPVSLGLIQPPGTYNADIAVAEGRCFGSPPAYGGPGLGLFATTESLLRRIPGRLAGCSLDRTGKRGFTLTLQTREQHIRREKATSNICTNQGWLALRATIFMALLGPQGLRTLAQRNLELAHYAFGRLKEIPWISAPFDKPFFNEFVLEYDDAHPVEKVHAALTKRGVAGGFPLGEWFTAAARRCVWCVTELTGKEAIDRALDGLKELA